MFSSDFPVPIATQSNGFSATKTGISVSSLITVLKFFNNAPPPESTIPLSIISADNSGGVFSNVTFIASTIFSTSSSRAVVISLDVIVIVLGKPVKRSHPRQSYRHLYLHSYYLLVPILVSQIQLLQQKVLQS